MQRILTLLCCLLLAVGFAQNKRAETLKISLPLSKVSERAVWTEVELPLHSVPAPDITSEYWTNSVYNPYKGVPVKFPLKISFEDSTYASPISRKKVVTSRYGWRWGRAHQGIDIDLITGDSLFAMFDGVVRMAVYNGGLGHAVVIRHYNGLETTYAHMSRYAVKANDSVRKGQYIGKGGRSGNARGSHLHLVVSYKGQYIHPDYLFEFDDTNKVHGKELFVMRPWTKAYYYSSRRLPKIDLITSEEKLAEFEDREKRLYIVKKGDTLSRISRRNNVTIEALCKSNSIKRNSVLRVGQKLIIEP
ncbi:peptidoglycan DD-metalloendopeptidase family protein [Winogradskyella aurantiaca]|uniref:peptidoglycan DD-metalloendopeptidase family protein n=1 Tax=Winogradskyella aurantiaca TaxID=2219558 RepID=UPI000E1DB437|nr:peptidoglycan DD-metalloendopeptidase family protein [Winogradskyella aurantiaca]